LTLSSKNQKEVIIHILNEVDIHFTNNNIDELLSAIQYVYFLHQQKNLPVYMAPGSLDLFVTTKADVADGVNI